MGDPHDLLLPEGARLVHIGPHKTGTSALQGAMHQARDELHAYGVHIAGEPPRPSRAVWAVTGASGPLGAPPARMAHWDHLVREIEDAGDQRVVVSNETFSLARADAVRRIVDDLGPDRVHVVGMLRRLDRILPSQWQQMIADGGHKISYHHWLERVFGEHGAEGFWRRHGYRELTERWADGVGAENVTMVVVDEADRDSNLRLFEKFLGLPDGTLQLVQSRSNRSLTFGEVEMLRAFNKEFKNLGWVNEAQRHFVRRGAIPAIKDRAPEPGEQRIVTPPWAVERAAESAQWGIEAVRSLGVRVIGDPAGLVRPLGAVGEPEPAPTRIAPEIAALAVSGVIEVATSRRPLTTLYERPDAPDERAAAPGAPEAEEDPGLRRVDDTTTGQLLEVLGERVRRRARRSGPNAPGRGMTEPTVLLRDGNGLVHVGTGEADAALLREAFTDKRAEAAELGVRVAEPTTGPTTGPTTEAVIEAVVADLGADRIQVLVTVPPLDELVGARWQRYVEDGQLGSYQEWLDGTLNRTGGDDLLGGDDLAASRPEDLVRRWCEAVGPDRLTVVAGAADQTTILRTAEQLLGLPQVLEPRSEDPGRRLTYGETELLRGLNEQSGVRRWPAGAYERYVRDGALAWLRRRVPRSSELPVPLPAWAASRLAEVATGSAQRIEALGVRVVGDMTAFAPQPPELFVPPPAAALAMIGAIGATGGEHPEPGAARQVRGMSTAALVRVVGERVLRRSVREMRRRTSRIR